MMTGRTARSALAASILFLPPLGAQAHVLDDFETLAAWTTHPSDGTTMRIAPAPGFRGRAMRIDYEFRGGGYAIVRRAIALEFPENYVLSFRVRGVSPSQNLEVKLVDSTGDNVWWRNHRDFEFPAQWRRVAIRKRQIEFAWGPLGGGELRRAAAIEIAITAGSGGRGTVWLDDLVLETKPEAAGPPPPPRASASSEARGSTAADAMDGDTATVWDAGAGARRWIALDLGPARELGGLTLDWLGGAHASAYDVQLSDDGVVWRTAYAVRGGDGGRDFIYLPETETRHLRLVLRAPVDRPVALREITVQPIAWSASRNAFFAAVAADAPRGDYPKYLSGIQSYWTIAGVNGDTKEALINEQGMLEVDKSAFSVEPFLRVDGRLLTWADVSTTPSLEGGYLPIPSVRWDAAGLRLTVTTFATGAPERSVLWARYRVENLGNAPARPTLYLALRPFQVNPPAQFLNTPGGAAIVRAISWDGRVARVTGGRGVMRHTLVPVTAPSAFGAATFDAGGIVAALRRGALPAAQRVADSLGAASAALAYPLELAAGGTRDVWIAVPLHAASPAPAARRTPAAADAIGAAALAAARSDWTAALDRVRVELPPAGRRFVESLKANLAYMLITRDRAALHPGARSYERAWIRDGAMMAAALLRLGRTEEARAFAEWYAPFQYPNGKVPCCVDARGADPVPENDSHGQLIYLIAEVHRFTGDRAFLERMWPRVPLAVAYIDSLRRSRMTPEYEQGAKRAYYGLVPQSISHEGYSAKPMHSFWDDLFVLRGLKDAVEIAAVLGRDADRARFAGIRDEFRRDVMAAYRATMALHGIDWLAGAVELGDFDATSTTVGVSPGGEQAFLPQPALNRTFEKYWEFFVARRDSAAWDAYTPYELRVVGTMVRLGWKDRAHALLDFFFPHQRPAAWRAWAEVVYRDTGATRFVGDLPHTWVGSDYIRSALDMLAYEREADSAIVIGAGVPAAWVAEDPGIIVRALRTPWGTLDLDMRADGDDVTVTLRADRAPPGGFIVRSPLARPVRRATLNGAPAAITSAGEVVVREPRGVVVLSH